MKKMTIGDLLAETEERKHVGGKTTLRDEYQRWAKKNKRNAFSGKTYEDWKKEPASTVLIIKCRL